MTVIGGAGLMVYWTTPPIVYGFFVIQPKWEKIENILKYKDIPNISGPIFVPFAMLDACMYIGVLSW